MLIAEGNDRIDLLILPSFYGTDHQTLAENLLRLDFKSNFLSDKRESFCPSFLYASLFVIIHLSVY